VVVSGGLVDGLVVDGPVGGATTGAGRPPVPPVELGVVPAVGPVVQRGVDEAVVGGGATECPVPGGAVVGVVVSEVVGDGTAGPPPVDRTPVVLAGVSRRSWPASTARVGPV
jgi:hypothetical protein